MILGKCLNCGYEVVISEYDGIVTHSQLAFGHDGLGGKLLSDPKGYNNGFWCDPQRTKTAVVSPEDWAAYRVGKVERDIAEAAEKLRMEAAKEQKEREELVYDITSIVRQADREFEKAGGSTRHWVRDHFLPLLEAEGMRVTRS